MSFSIEHHHIILIAPGYNEEFVMRLRASFNKCKATVRLVSPADNLVIGDSGLKIKPDHYLSQLDTRPLQNTHAPLSVIIPGGDQAASRLLADPRVVDLLRRTLLNNGRVILTPTAYRLFQALQLEEQTTGNNLMLTRSHFTEETEQQLQHCLGSELW